MVLVDSSVWIEAARRDGNLAAKVGLECLLQEYEATWCGPVRMEVLSGARTSERRVLAQHFECIPYQPMTDRAWELATQSCWRLRDKGHTLPWNDILIGSLAIHWECRVYALDKHFDVMKDILGLRLYIPDYGGKFRCD